MTLETEPFPFAYGQQDELLASLAIKEQQFLFQALVPNT
jgi:hypothetical protein